MTKQVAEDDFGDKAPLVPLVACKDGHTDHRLDSPTYIPTSKEETIRLGREAWIDLSTKNQQWDKWLAVGAALVVGRADVMFEVGTNAPCGAKYNKAFRAWLTQHGFDARV